MLWFLTIFFGLTSANLIWAVKLMTPPAVRAQSVLQSPEAAAAFGWASEPPAPWPAPTQLLLNEESGRLWIILYTESGGEHYGMHVMRYGWPLHVFQSVSTTGPTRGVGGLPDREVTEVLWFGLMAAPLVVATVLTAAGVLPGVVVRVVRRRGGRCERCGYPRGTASLCTECGTSFEDVVPRI